MIRFFSKMRYKLAAENRAAKYLRYAIGEILLVVIGILIAVQVNNWNERRKERIQEQLLIQSIISDLKSDTLMINQNLRILQADTTKVFGFIKRMSDNKVTIDTLVQIARFEFDPRTHVNATFNDNTFKSLLSTGSLKILETWIQDELLQINEMHDANISRTQLNSGAYVSQITAFARKYPLSDYGNISPVSKLADAIWAEAEFEELGVYLNAMLAIRNVTNLYAINQLKEILDKTNEFLVRINKYNNSPNP
ncbi:DUF6090 family protein [Draconibacterium mangrovi]|uniref:DUF6090 family protein n=1 Tax=Draconibacterium mangrovi TaxID=2697469 RepID=UPI0013D5412C|nr:DUF6090 family protein [Draconibacterium mangrovi]